jgi:hypothetical protein
MMTVIVYYILRASFVLFNLAKPIWFIFSQKHIERYFHYLFTFFGYRGALISDLESYVKAGSVRAEWVRKFGKWKCSRKLKISENKIKFGFLGIAGKETNFPKEFFLNAPSNIEIYIFDILRNTRSVYTGTEMFKEKENIHYKKIKIDHYLSSQHNYQSCIDMIEVSGLDMLLTNFHTYHMPILDQISVPVVVSMNFHSLVTPHPKCMVQSFLQPPWPYEVRNNKIFNLKKRHELTFPWVNKELFIFNKRATKLFNTKLFEKREDQIFFSGNMKKLNSFHFFSIVSKLMKANDKLKLCVYSSPQDKYHAEINKKLGELEILNRYQFKGEFAQSMDMEGSYLLDKPLQNAFEDLSNSKLMLNTFPISGARNCIEAYALEVPVIHLDFEVENWIEKQDLLNFKLPCILTSRGTAKSIDEYFQLAMRTLNDLDYAKALIEEQKVVLEKVSSSLLLWEHLEGSLNHYPYK